MWSGLKRQLRNAKWTSSKVKKEKKFGVGFVL
jgi:hypothetical protein